MVFYNYDSNSIFVEPIKSRSERNLTQAFAKLNQHLTDRGLKQVLKILYNECPHGLKRYMQSVTLTYQLVPPHIHRTNAAKKIYRHLEILFPCRLGQH